MNGYSFIYNLCPVLSICKRLKKRQDIADFSFLNSSEGH